MSLFHHQNVRIGRRGIQRRSFLHYVSAGAVAAGTLNFRDLMSLQAAELRKQGRSMILLWMQGGPSQFETFDPKPGTDNGGPTEAISTAVSYWVIPSTIIVLMAGIRLSRNAIVFCCAMN